MAKFLILAACAAALAGCAASPLGAAALTADDRCQRTVDAELIVAAPMPPSGRVTIHKVCEATLGVGQEPPAPR